MDYFHGIFLNFMLSWGYLSILSDSWISRGTYIRRKVKEIKGGGRIEEFIYCGSHPLLGSGLRYSECRT